MTLKNIIIQLTLLIAFNSLCLADYLCNDSTCAKEALPYAILSSAAYGNNKEVDGWKIVKNYNWFDGCRLLWDRIFNIECGFDGFHATLYKKDGQEEYVLAFRGTNGPMDLFITDLVQYATSVDSQYDQAVNITDELLTIGYNGTPIKKDNLTLTGHSLGGGLATVASLRTGLKAYIFNPARIGYAGIPIIDSHPDSKIKAFVSYDLASGRKDFVASQGWQDI